MIRIVVDVAIRCLRGPPGSCLGIAEKAASSTVQQECQQEPSNRSTVCTGSLRGAAANTLQAGSCRPSAVPCPLDALQTSVEAESQDLGIASAVSQHLQGWS